MTSDELLAYLKNRELNNKTNNMIIVGDELNTLIDDIPDVTGISFIDDDIDIDVALNIKIDLSKVSVKDILTYVLSYLKKQKIIDEYFDYTLPFNNKFDIVKFKSILQKYNIIVQLVCYNIDGLSIEEQMLFNELYYYNSPFFIIISLIKDKFKTYFLTQDRVLDDREDYQKYEIIKPYTLTKKLNGMNENKTNKTL